MISKVIILDKLAIAVGVRESFSYTILSDFVSTTIACLEFLSLNLVYAIDLGDSPIKSDKLIDTNLIVVFTNLVFLISIHPLLKISL